MMKQLWFAPLLLVGACSLTPWLERGRSVEAIEVGRAQHCGTQGREARVRLFDSPAAAADWQRQAGIDLHIDGMLEPGRYALIELGERSTGGHGLAVSREARTAGRALRVYATFFSPAPGAMATQALTSPCVLVRLPDIGYEAVEVFDQDGTLRARGAAP